jgi:hypothetical protein
LVFLAKAKDGDYHQEMNGPIFLNWFENQLMPALKSSSVIVLDNARSVHFLVIIPIFSFGKKIQITPINQTLLTITSVQNYQPFTFS